MKLLISIEEIKTSTIVNNNVDEKYLLSSIETAQVIKLQQLIGSKLYNHLIDCIDDNGQWTGNNDEYELVKSYIQPYLKRQVVSDLIVPLSWKLRNEGVIQNTSENTYNPMRSDLMYVKEHYENEASYFATRLSNYLCENTTKFPLYLECGNPSKNKNAKNTIIYLG